MSRIACCFVLFCTALHSGLSFAQTNRLIQPDRVLARPDGRVSTRLEGHVPSWATASRDRGAVPSGAELNLTFVLSRSAEMQAQFAQLLADQQNPSSSRYHQWLTAQQVGEQYGPTQHDLDALTDWLRSQGLTVKEVAPSGVFVHVSGAAATVAAALNTEFHAFERDGGGLRMSTTMEPSIPSALAPIAASISGLAETEFRATQHGGTGKVLADADGVHPEITSNGSHYITPGDFATIFDLNSVYSAGLNGTGQRVAVIGRSRVAVSDITEFESKTGLPTNTPNVVIPTSGTDPGATGDGDQAEATLDVERVVGVASGAQVDLVVSGTSGSSNGISIAAQYEVQTLLDPVMNISFSSCEAYGGSSAVAEWDTLFSQAASEGISVFVASGDSGAAGCDEALVSPPLTQMLSINAICSSSYATCVGGTEFADLSNTSQYWSSTNSSSLTSALQYIPEGAWNEPASSTTPSQVASGGGGASIYVPKPLWQAGTGVPADNVRDVPDVSFPSAAHDGYYACYATGGGDCSSNEFYYFFGTSDASPSMAGVAAILNQKLGAAQGNLNPLLYRIAASTPNAFHDATPASSGVNLCYLDNPSMCNNSTPTAGSTAGFAGYALTTGYDQATGLGSLDIANFLAAASSASHSGPATTTLVVQGSASTISNTGTVTLTATVSSKTSGAPTGTVQFYANGIALGTSLPVSSGVATTAALPFASAGTYYITAMYSGDSSYAASTAPGFSLVVTGQGSTTTVTASTAQILVGTHAMFSAAVAGSPGATEPTGMMRFLVLGTDSSDYVVNVPLVNGSATTPFLVFPTVGTYTVTANYLGDAVYSPSSSNLSYAVNKLPSITNLGGVVKSVGMGGGNSYEVGVVGVAGGPGTTAPAPTGTIQLYVDGVAQGSPVTLASGSDVNVNFPNAGTFTVTAVYSGDSYWLPSTSTPFNQTVLSQPPTLSMQSTTTTLSFAAGATTANSDMITVISGLGFSGTVNLSCTVAYNGTGSAGSSPTCSLSKPSATVLPSQLSFQSVVTISSTARPNIVAANSHLSQSRGGISQVIGLCVAALWLVPVRRRNWRSLLGVLIVFSGLTMLSGCSGGGSGSSNAPPPGTASGSYTATVTATTTAAGISAPAPLTIALTIN
jgi:pseudomonalisin